jgi:N-carbamoylputrescine amidase
MIVTICELHDRDELLAQDWRDLMRHVRNEKSDLVLLPEMPFYSQLVLSPRFDQRMWDKAVEAHATWEKRLAELWPAVVVGTRPIDFGNERYEEGFIWSAGDGLRGVHAKTQLYAELDAFENPWYQCAAPDFVPMQAGEATIGFLIGSELWAVEEARRYRDEGVDILVTPRLSSMLEPRSWLTAGRRAAVVARAFGLASAHTDEAWRSEGCGWVFGPDGELLAMTSRTRPFVSVSVDLQRASAAKSCGVR